MKKTIQEKINTLAKLFDANSGELVRTPCRGKWAGTIDYSIKFDNGGIFFLANGYKAAIQYIDTSICLYSSFRRLETQEKIKAYLKGLQEADNLEAAAMGLKQYKVIRPSYVRQPGARFFGWFYVLIEVDGKTVPMLESGLSCALRLIAAGEEKIYPSVLERAKKYFVAGGLQDNEIDYVYRGVGHSTISELYKAF